MRNILNKQSKLWMFRHVKIVIKLATYMLSRYKITGQKARIDWCYKRASLENHGSLFDQLHVSFLY